jgi:hypothetical protein
MRPNALTPKDVLLAKNSKETTAKSRHAVRTIMSFRLIAGVNGFVCDLHQVSCGVEIA